ncbi:MAG: DUF4157 domain-containing protein [Cyanobacteria bacterium P01_G01_bin.54]
MKKYIIKPTWKAPTAQAKPDEKKRKSGQSLPIGNFAPNVLMDNVTTAPFSSLPVQPKLTIGEVGDQYEQEADQVAAQVVQQINSPAGKSAQAQVAEDPVQLEPTVQRQNLSGSKAAPELESEINQAKGGGQSLDPGLQRSMGQVMGMDLSHVKVHTDNTSHELNQTLQAKAFTTGQDVFFGKGQYQPGSKRGQELIAHELTHVGQQTGTQVQRKPTDSQIQRDGLTDISREVVQQEPKYCTSEHALRLMDKCAKCKTSRELKVMHLITEYNQENLFFLDAFTKYRQSPNRASMLKIYDKYVKSGSEFMVNISYGVRNQIEQQINNTPSNETPNYLLYVFHSASKEVYDIFTDIAQRYPATVDKQQAIVIHNLVSTGQASYEDFSDVKLRRGVSIYKGADYKDQFIKTKKDIQKQIEKKLKDYSWHKRLTAKAKEQASEDITHG